VSARFERDFETLAHDPDVLAMLAQGPRTVAPHGTIAPHGSVAQRSPAPSAGQQLLSCFAAATIAGAATRRGTHAAPSNGTALVTAGEQGMSPSAHQLSPSAHALTILPPSFDMASGEGVYEQHSRIRRVQPTGGRHILASRLPSAISPRGTGQLTTTRSGSSRGFRSQLPSSSGNTVV
jgi:hypothetical protein